MNAGAAMPRAAECAGRCATSQTIAGSTRIAVCGVAHQPRPASSPSPAQLEPRVALAQAKREQRRAETEHEPGAVEPVSARRLPDEVRRTGPEEHGGDARARLADRPAPDPPDEDRRHGPEQQRDEPDRRRARAEQPEHGDREQRLLGPSVRLAPEERRQVPVREVARHQPPDGLVPVERACARQQHPEPEHDSRDDAADDDEVDDRGPPRHSHAGKRTHPSRLHSADAGRGARAQLVGTVAGGPRRRTCRDSAGRPRRPRPRVAGPASLRLQPASRGRVRLLLGRP